MRLEHSFTVPVPVETAWQALLDPARVAPCFPGATLTGIDGPEFSGTVKVRLGPVSLLYKGTGRFASVDEAARRLILEATGKDSRGNGTASATVAATLSPGSLSGVGAGSGVSPGDSTTVGVVTDLTITGRPAQLGRGLVNEVGSKILDAFAGCLATELAGSADAPAPASSIGLSPEPAQVARTAASADEIDLLDLAGKPLIKRLIPVLAAAVLALLLLRRWLRRRSPATDVAFR
jgi:uncharacterized protein